MIAALQGLPNAELSIGQMFEAGRGGLPKNEQTAALWYKLA